MRELHLKISHSQTFVLNGANIQYYVCDSKGNFHCLSRTNIPTGPGKSDARKGVAGYLEDGPPLSK